MAKKNKAFTLIELLVVISLIGLISAVVFVSLREGKEEAEVASVKQFSAQINHSLGAYAAGMWNFNDGTGIDSSGNKLDGVIQGDATPVDGIMGGGMYFDGEDDYVRIDNELEFEDKMTIEFWFKPDALSGGGGYHDVINNASGSGSFYMWFHNEGNIEIKLGCSNCIINYNTASVLEVDRWMHFVCTYDGNIMRIYVNGEEIASEPNANGNIGDIGSPLDIGTYDPGWGYGTHGILDEIRIYKKELIASEIYGLYAQGAIKRGLVKK